MQKGYQTHSNWLLPLLQLYIFILLLNITTYKNITFYLTIKLLKKHLCIHLQRQSTVENVYRSAVHQLAGCKMSDVTVKTVELSISRHNMGDFKTNEDKHGFFSKI